MRKTRTPIIIKTKIKFNKNKYHKENFNKRLPITTERAINNKYLYLNKISSLNEYRTKIENKYNSKIDKEKKLNKRYLTINENFNSNNLNKVNEKPKKMITSPIYNIPKQEMKKEKTFVPQKNNINNYRIIDNNADLLLDNYNSRNTKKEYIKFSDMYNNCGNNIENKKLESQSNSRYLRVKKKIDLKNGKSHSKNIRFLKNNILINSSNVSSITFDKIMRDNINKDKSKRSIVKEDLSAISYLKKNRYLNLDNDNFFIPNNRSYDIIQKTMENSHDNLKCNNKITIRVSQKYPKEYKNKVLKIKTDDNTGKIYVNNLQKKGESGIKKYFIDINEKCQTENYLNLTTRNETVNSYNEYLKQKKNLLYLKPRDYKIIENKMKEDLRSKTNLKSLSINQNCQENNKIIKFIDRNNKNKLIEAKMKYNTINCSYENQYVKYNNSVRTIDIDKSKDIFKFLA